MANIFYFEDMEKWRKIYIPWLERLGHSVDAHATFEDAIDAARSLKRVPDLAILDLADELRGAEAGFDICRALRERFPELFVLFLTAHEHYTIKAKESGINADDYVVKDVESFAYLKLTIDHLLERTKAITTPESERPTLVRDDLTVFQDGTNIVSWRGQNVRLPPKQFLILQFLAQNAGTAYPVERLVSVANIEAIPYDEAEESVMGKIRDAERSLTTIWEQRFGKRPSIDDLDDLIDAEQPPSELAGEEPFVKALAEARHWRSFTPVDIEQHRDVLHTQRIKTHMSGIRRALRQVDDTYDELSRLGGGLQAIAGGRYMWVRNGPYDARLK